MGSAFTFRPTCPGTRRRSHVWERDGRSCGPGTACWEPATRSRPMPPATAAVGLPRSESPCPWIGPRGTTAWSLVGRESIARSAARSRSWSGRLGRAGGPGFSCSAPPTPTPPTTVGAGTRSIAAPTDPPTGSPSTGPMRGSPRMASTCSPSKAGLRRTWMSGVFPSLCRRLSGGSESSCPPIPSFR